MTLSKTRIAIIGAGSSGLTQLKQLLDAFARSAVKSELEVVVYESRKDIGGTWYREPGPKPYRRYKSKNGQMCFSPIPGENPSPMYDGLRTNLPYDLMSFRDLPMKSETLFPDQVAVEEYLKLYAERFELYRHIRFSTKVTRLRLNEKSGRRWTLSSRSTDSSDTRSGVDSEEEFDYVCVANGHYADSWIPDIPGLDSFTGEVLHSRYYRRAEDYTGRNVMVVGSFASGSDLARQMGGLNVGKYDAKGEPTTSTLTNGHKQNGKSSQSNGDGQSGGFTKVYQSSSPGPNHYAAPPGPGDAPQPWRDFVKNVPLISHISPPSSTSTSKYGTIHFQNDSHPPVEDVDTIIFATGYNYSLPFCHPSDAPWNTASPLDNTLETGKEAGDKTVGTGVHLNSEGLRGLAMRHIDELMLFMEGDRSISFPALQYQIVPFPLAETQARLTALLWAGLLPSFPKHPVLPPNPDNPYFEDANSAPKDSNGPSHAGNGHANGSSKDEVQANGDSLETSESQGNGEKSKGKKPVRKVLAMRQKLVFGSPFQFDYEEYLMKLMYEAEGEKTPEHWRKIEDWRRARREDTTLRRRTLGY